MKLTLEEKQTLKTYDSYAHEWAAEHSIYGFWKDEINTFKKLLPAGKILEIGAGGGRDAKELIKFGYDYLGTDISEGLLEEARKLNPKAIFENKSVYELNYPENLFDGFWACAVLLHIPKKRIDYVLKKLHREIRNNGIGLIVIKKGRGERVEEDILKAGKKGIKFFAYYSQKEFKAILERNNYKIIEMKTKPVSKKTTWLIYFVKVVK